MNRLSLRWKTILGVAGIEMILLIMLVSLTLGQMRDSSNDGLVKRANAVSKLFATTSKDATLSYDLASLESFVAEVMKNPDIVYARVAGSDGQELATAGEPLVAIDQFKADSSIESVADGIYDATAPIIEGGELYGTVQVGIDIGLIASNMADLKRWSYSIVALELVLVALFSFMLGTYLTSQLASLRRAAREVANDTLSVELPVKSKDEIGEVALAFNKMVQRLKESRQKRDEYERELEKLNITLEQRVEERTKQLSESLNRLQKAKTDLERETVVRQQAETQMRQAQKLEAVGQLAGGVAHEINTPLQYIGDSMHFVLDAVREFSRYCHEVKEIALSACDPNEAQAVAARIDEIQVECDIEYLNYNAPMAIERALEGVDRVCEVVSAMKTFGVARNTVKEPASINQAIEQTVVVTRHEHRYYAKVVMELDDDLPSINCHVSDITQVFLQIVVNAAHAVADRYGEGQQGEITIRSCQQEQDIVVTVSDNGIGMPAEVREKVFDPFFTTKEVGRGNGQGLSVAYDAVVNSHGGSIQVDSQLDEGTTFTVRLPIEKFEFRRFLKSDPIAILE